MAWWDDVNKNVNGWLKDFTSGKFGQNGGKPLYTQDIEKMAKGPTQAKPAPRVSAPGGSVSGNTHTTIRKGITPIPKKPPRDGRNTLPPGWRERNERMNAQEAPPSPLDVLMERLSQGYQGVDPSKIDFSAMDKALESRLGALGGARNNIQGNFDKSDVALEGMHRAFENQVRTEDAARYNQIADTQKANLQSGAQAGIGNMEAARAKAVAERQAMLQNLGIQEAGAAVDPGAEALNRGIQAVQERNNINQGMAEQQRGTNLAYNNTVAQSIGQAGVARRSALQQQLQGLLGKVDMAEAEARTQNEVERSRQMSQANNAGYDQWNDQQNRYMDMFDRISQNEIAREKMGMQTLPQEKPRGMAQIASDLEMSGADPAMAQRGLAALGQILAEGNYLEGANGPEGNTPYDRVNIITQRLKAKGVDPFTASQIGMSYGNM